MRVLTIVLPKVPFIAQDQEPFKARARLSIDSGNAVRAEIASAKDCPYINATSSLGHSRAFWQSTAGVRQAPSSSAKSIDTAASAPARCPTDPSPGS